MFWLISVGFLLSALVFVLSVILSVVEFFSGEFFGCVKYLLLAAAILFLQIKDSGGWNVLPKNVQWCRSGSCVDYGKGREVLLWSSALCGVIVLFIAKLYAFVILFFVLSILSACFVVFKQRIRLVAKHKTSLPVKRRFS